MENKQGRLLLGITLLFICVIGTSHAFAEEGQSVGGKVSDVLFRPIQVFFSNMRDIAGQILSETVLKSQLTEENRELHVKLSLLEGESRQNVALKEENRRLRTLLSLAKEQEPTKTLACRVIAQDPTGVRKVFRIDGGQEQGIRVEDTVICETGLVGRVTAVYRNSAIVTPYTETASAVAARVVRTQEAGIAELKDDGLFFTCFSENARLLEGDSVETAGSGGIYPAGLLLGTVKRAEKQAAALSPSVDYRTLREVLVLLIEN